MDGTFVWLALSVGAFLMFYLRPPPPPDQSIDLHKQISRRPVIKFLMLPVIKVTDKETQTDEIYKSPMSLGSVSLDFPFDFDEDYLNGSNTLHNNSPCERNLTNGSTE